MVVRKITPKRNIVHLGNVGEDNAFRSKKLAKRFPDFNFYGIDLKNVNNKSFVHSEHRLYLDRYLSLKKKLKETMPSNLKQYELEFIEGLLKFENSTIDLITSDFSLGFYSKTKSFKELRMINFKDLFQIFSHLKNAKEYTKEVINVIYDKLKPNGKIIIYVFDRKRYLNNVVESLKFKFTDDKIIISKVDVKKFDSRYKSYYLDFLSGNRVIYKIVAKK